MAERGTQRHDYEGGRTLIPDRLRPHPFEQVRETTAVGHPIRRVLDARRQLHARHAGRGPEEHYPLPSHRRLRIVTLSSPQVGCRSGARTTSGPSLAGVERLTYGPCPSSRAVR